MRTLRTVLGFLHSRATGSGRPARRVIPLAVWVVGVLMLAPIASAVQPTMVEFQVERTRPLLPAETGCSFDLVRHSSGTYHITTFYDASGNVIRTQNFVSNYRIVDSNPVSGNSLTTALAGPLIITPNADGTVTVTIPGNDGKLTAPGEGVIWSNTGLLIYIASPDDPFTPLEILTVHGAYTDLNGPYPEACAVLA
jgi:hypothetical protein